jgi:hypothetical protein
MNSDAMMNSHLPYKTECDYQVASGVGPHVEFSVDWGGGEAAMTATKIMGRIETGLASRRRRRESLMRPRRECNTCFTLRLC